MGQRSKELWGHEFPVVDKGLCEATVVTFVNRLVLERDSLAKSQKHLEHLQKLAEKMVIEADDMAIAIKQRAESEASELLDITKSRAVEIADEAHKIFTQSTRETDHVLDEIQREADLLKVKLTEDIERKLDEAWVKLCDQGKTLTSKVETELSAELNNLSESIKAFEVKRSGDLMDKEQEPVEDRLPSADAFEGLIADKGLITGESLDVDEGQTTEVSLATDVMEDAEITPVQGGEEVLTVARVEEEELAGEAQVPEVDLIPGIAADSEEADSYFSMPVLYYGSVELDIAPPLDAIKMQLLVKELKMYGIEFHDMADPSADRSTVNLFLKTPMDLRAVIESVEGIQIYGCSNNGSNSREPQKLNIRSGR